MPAYEYKCIDCGAEEERIAGLDDNTALCVGLRQFDVASG